MIRPFPLEKLKATKELIPQAILAVSIFEIAKRYKFEIEKGHDDLDYYTGIGGMSEFGYPFAVMHYRGYPEDTSTIYLPRDFGDDIDEITKAVHSIADELKDSRQIVHLGTKERSRSLALSVSLDVCEPSRCVRADIAIDKTAYRNQFGRETAFTTLA